MLSKFKGLSYIYFINILCLMFYCVGLAKAQTGQRDYAPEDYNVILISVCSLRADHLGCYGYSRNISPNIDKLAKEGILFENAFSQSNFTLPSLFSIHTSLYPQSHGMATDAERLSSKIKTLAEILNLHGYDTAYFLDPKDIHTTPRLGLCRGFEQIIDIYPKGLRCSIGREDRKMFRWLKNMRKTPFFLSCHNIDLHYPYLPSPKYRNLLIKKTASDFPDSLIDFKKLRFNLIGADLKDTQNKIYEIFEKDKIAFLSDIVQGGFTKKQRKRLKRLIKLLPDHKRGDFESLYNPEALFLRIIKPSDIPYLAELYDACIREFDEGFIKPLISKLKELGLYDTTMIIIMGDHGEEFYEHEGFIHNLTLYDEMLRVPLVIKLPKDILYTRNHINGLVQSIDIMPTVLDILSMPVPFNAAGISLKRTFEDGNDNILNERHAYAYAPITGLKSIRSKNYKLILHLRDSQHEFYNLKEDPQERHNLYNQKAAIVKEMEEAFNKWEKGLISYVVAENKLLPEIDEAARERIKRTGYWEIKEDFFDEVDNKK